MGFNSFEFADQVCFSLIGNLDTEARGNDTLNHWTDNTADLNTAWQLGPSPLTAIIDALPNDPTNPDPDAMSTFLTDYMSSVSANVNNFCAADITTLLGRLTSNWSTKSGSASSTQMSEIQQFGNLVSATQQIQTSSGDTETKSEASYLQQTTSSGQTQADMGNSAIGILSTVASLTMQSFL